MNSVKAKGKHTLVRITTVPQSFWKLLEGQLKFMSQYYDVHAVSSPGEISETVVEQEGVPFHSVSFTREVTPLRDLVSIWRLYRVLRKLKPTIVHTHTPKAGLVGMIASRLARVPIRMHTVAGMPVETKTGFKKRLLLWVEKVTYANAHKVYPNSHGLLKLIQDHRLCKPAKLTVIGKGSSNGINLDWFRPTAELNKQAEQIRSDAGIQQEDLVFCYIGRLVRDKGFEELMEAFEKLNQSIANVHLVVLGKAEEALDPISASANRTLNENPHVHYYGLQVDVRPYLAASDFFVFPSYREGLPNVLLQAGAMGLPSIASRINGNTDIIEDDVNGVFVDVRSSTQLGNAMKRFCEDRQLTNRLGAAARLRIEENYQQEKLWDCLHQEYESNISESTKLDHS